MPKSMESGETRNMNKQVRLGKSKAAKQALVRPMCEGDIHEIMKIEVESFSVPWSHQAFTSELKDNDYAHYFCLELNGQIIGYMGLWFIFEEGHVTNIAIAPDYRGQGWGEHLLRCVMGRLSAEGMERMTLEVRKSNHNAQKLYQRLGFVEAGIRKGYYSDTGEDAVIMWVELNEKTLGSPC